MDIENMIIYPIKNCESLKENEIMKCASPPPKKYNESGNPEPERYMLHVSPFMVSASNFSDENMQYGITTETRKL